MLDEIKENTGSDDNHFPRVEACGGGAYCCRQDTSPFCNKDNIPKTHLDHNGISLSGPPTETGSMTTASFTGTMVSSLKSGGSTPSEDAVSSSPDSESGSSKTIVLKIGLGVSIPFVAVITALVTLYFLRKSQGKKNQSTDKSAAMQKNTLLSSPSQAYEVHEMMGRPMEGDRARVPPRELMGPGTEVY